jgi:hypothetical protein
MHLLKFHATLFPFRQKVTVQATTVLTAADQLQAFDADFAVIMADKPVHADKALIPVTVIFR